MLIHFRCECGKHIIMSRKFAGRRARCEQCGQIVVVPRRSTIAVDAAEPSSPAKAAHPHTAQAAPAEGELRLAPAATPTPDSTAAAGRPPPPPAGSADNGDEPVLIPVAVPGMPTLNVSGARLAALRHAATDQPMVQRIPVTFIVGLILCLLAALACGAGTLLPWTNIPQPPGMSKARGILALFATQQTVDELLDRAPPSSRQFWPLPATLLALGLVGAVMPWRRFRGGMLLVTGVAAAAVWFTIVRWIDLELLAWTPLARYLETPRVWTRTWQPTAPTLGSGAWVTAGALVLVLTAAFLNLCRSRREVLIAALPTALLLVLGVSHLRDWYRPAAVRVAATAQISPVTYFTDRRGNPSSEVTADVTVWNRARRPIVLAPRRSPARLASATSSAEDWLAPWGQPELMLSLERDKATAAAGYRDTAAASFIFGREGSLGCVLRPQERAAVRLRFAPVWDQWRAERGSKAGKWSLALLDAEHQVVHTVDLNIPGAPHPNDDDVGELLAAVAAAPTQVQAALDAFLRLAQPAADQAASLSETQARAAARQLGQAAAELHTCQERIAALQQHGISPPTETQAQVDRVARRLGNPIMSATAALLADLEQGKARAAAEKLRWVADAEPAAESVEAAALGLMAPLVLAHAADLSQGEHHREVLELLTALSGALEPRSDLRRPAATLLEQAALCLLAESGTALVGPKGQMKVAAPKTIAAVPIPATDRPASPRPVPPPAPEAAPARRPSSSADDDPGYLAAALTRVAEWDPSASARSDFGYGELLAAKCAGTLTEEDVGEFLERHPEAARSAEALCWLGLKALETQRFAVAAQHFTQTLEPGAPGEHAPLARLGLALATCNTSEDDLITRVMAEHRVSDYLAEREDWSDDLRQLILGSLPHAIGLFGEPLDINWVKDVALITTKAELANWLAGSRATLPWLRLHEQLDPQQESELRKFVLTGGIILTSTPLFTTFGHLPCQKPDAALLRGEAHPVREWNDQRISYPFLSGVETVEYDASDFGVLIRAKPAREAGEKVQALLAVNDDWLASVVRLRREGGAAVFLPGRIADTPGGRAFLSGLVEHAVAQSAAGQRFEQDKARSKVLRPVRP